MQNSINFGVFVGRFCPIHLGHEAIIQKMISECGVGNSLVVVGSVNHEPTMRHFFSYDERKNFIKKLFPDIKIVGLADFKTDGEWISALEDTLNLAGFARENTKYFGGCEEDVRFFIDLNMPVSITNRFDGSSPKISATEVRDALIHSRPLSDLLNPLISNDIKKLFEEKWEKFKKM